MRVCKAKEWQARRVVCPKREPQETLKYLVRLKRARNEGEDTRIHHEGSDST
jgi:hypothetical protein